MLKWKQYFKNHFSSPKTTEGTMSRNREILYWGLTIGWFVLVTALVAMTPEKSGFFGLSIPLRGVVLGGVLIWLFSSIRVIAVDEIAIALVYGYPSITLTRGPKIGIRGVFQVQHFPAEVVQVQFPDEPELVQKTPDEVPLETVIVYDGDGNAMERKKVRPIRISTRKSGTSDDILDTQLAVEVSFWVRWKITDPYEFILTSGGDVDELIRQLRDSGESSLNEEITKRSTSELISEFNEVQKSLENKIKDDVIGWGVWIIGVGLNAPDLTHSLSSEMRNIASVKAKAQQTRITAEATRYATEQAGIATANAEKARIVAEGEGFKESAEIMGISTQELLAADVARKTIGEGDIILGTEGIVQAIGLGKKILEQAQPKGKIIVGDK